jgi:excisionase family DNA binding protein
MTIAPSPSPSLEPELLTPAEAMRLLRVSRSWLYEAARDGRIPSIRVGGQDGPVRFVKGDLLAHIDTARAAWRPGDSGAAALRRIVEAG